MAQINNSKNVLVDVTIGNVAGNFHVGDVINLHFIDEASGKAFIKEYHNTKEDAERLRNEFRQELSEIQTFLKRRQEPILQQFAETIYNIAYIENAHFTGHGRVDIGQAGKVTIDNRMLNEKQKDRLELLEGLQRRFKKRLNEKMKTELRFKLELNLQYTKEGTNETYLKDYYIDSYEEKSADSFLQLFQDYETKLKRLLILGEAGAGKTVLLLQFGLALVELAKQDFNYPIPVLLSVATWRDEDQPFETWLQESLVHSVGEYGISKKYAKELVKENNLLLILDGLDETPETDQKIFLPKLQTYLDQLDNARPTEHNYPTVILSSRKQGYLALQTQAPVRATIDIAPLAPEAVWKELERIKQSQDIRAKILLNRIVEIPEIATKLTTAFEIHLALVMSNTFDFSQLSTSSLVKAYIDQEIDKLALKQPKAKHYLSFLAGKMKEDKKGITFELIDMQPDWLNRFYKFKLLYALIITFFSYPILFMLNNASNTTMSSPYFYAISCIVLFSSFILFKNNTHTNWNLTKKIIVITLFITIIFIFIRQIFYYGNLSKMFSSYTSIIYPILIIIFFIISVFFACYIIVLTITTNSFKYVIRIKEIQVVYFKKFYARITMNFIKYLPESIVIPFFAMFATFGFPPIVSFFDSNIFPLIISLVFLGIPLSILKSLINSFFISKRNIITIKPYKRFYNQIWIDLIKVNVYTLLLVVSIPYYFNFFVGFFLFSCFSTSVLITSPLFEHYLLRFLLFFESKTPLFYRRFLNKVSDTGIMEKEGGQWRFRHQFIYDNIANNYQKTIITKRWIFIEISIFLIIVICIIFYFPSPKMSYFELGNKAFSEKNSEKALANYLKALPKDTTTKEYLDVLRQIIRTYYEIGRYGMRDYENTYIYQKKLSISEPKNYNNWYVLSFYALFVGKPQEAIEYAQKSLSLSPEQNGVITNLVLGYVLNNQWDKAEPLYREWKDKKFNGEDKLSKKIFLQDIAELEKAGVKHENFEKIKKMMKE